MSSLSEMLVSEVTSRRILELDAYWQSKRRGDALPARSDILPDEIRHLLPNLIIADIEPEPFRVRYRLSGTMIATYDEELAGKYLDELDNTSPEEIAAFYAFYRLVLAERRPLFCRSVVPSRQTGHELLQEGGLWPLSTDGVTIDKCVALQDFISLR
jgi:hypothetical protein